jgi:hypothetical protein
MLDGRSGTDRGHGVTGMKSDHGFLLEVKTARLRLCWIAQAMTTKVRG